MHRGQWWAVAVVCLGFGCGRTSSSGPKTPADAGRGGVSTAEGGTIGAGGSITGNGGSAPDANGAGGSTLDSATSVGQGGSGTGGSIPGSGGMPGTGGVAVACGACQALEQCWNGKLCIASSVSVTAGFSIDATEVTRGQYAAWLATSPSTGGQSSVCSWNATFVPDPNCMAKSSVCQSMGCTEHPQVCVDLCDAVAYCNAVGKRLCGAIGGASVSGSLMSDPTKSQWYNACSSNGVNQFTYGNSMTWGTSCNDGLSMATTTTPVGSKSACQSSIPGYAGVFDLIGNVWEWEYNCAGSAGAGDGCHPRGGSFGISATVQDCSLGIPTSRSTASDDIGFRCCGP